MKKLLAAGAGAVVLGSTLAAPAMAYPPGVRAEVYTDRAVYNARQWIRAQAVSVQPGCRVRIRWQGFNFQRTRTVTANRNGVAQSKVRAPRTNRTARYRVIILTKGSGCRQESDRNLFKVRRG